MKETLYSKLFKLDLKMLNLRRDWNKAYGIFIDNMRKYKVEDEKDWKLYQEIRDNMIKNAWSTFKEDSDLK